MIRTLDVSRLPERCRLGEGDISFDPAAVANMMRTAIDDWANMRLIAPTTNFGFAMAKPDFNATTDWDNPYSLIWFVAGWGPERERYIANAVRKMRAAARQQLDTLYLTMSHGVVFREVVASQEPDGTFAWGDYPYGGAVYVDHQGAPLLGAVSGLTQEEDDAVARIILTMLGLQIHKLGQS